MGYTEVAASEGDNVSHGEICWLALSYGYGITLSDQGVHTISRYLEGEGFPLPQLFQDHMIDELCISRIFHGGLE